MKVRWNRGMAVGIRILMITILVILGFILLVIGLLFAHGCMGGGKLHVDVIIPAAVTTSGKQWIRAAVDAHDCQSGDFTYPVILPDNTIVYMTRTGALGTEELMEQGYRERIKKGWIPWVFKVKKDTIWDRLTWLYIHWAGSRAGHPEGAKGNP